MLNVWSSTYFLGEVTDGVDLDLLSILCIELCSGSLLPCLLKRHGFAYYRKVLLYLTVNQILNSLQLLLSKSLWVVEVESETLSCNVGAQLLNISSQNLRKSLVEKVCCCVEGSGGFAMVSKTALELLLSSSS